MKRLILGLVSIGFAVAMLSACGTNNSCPGGQFINGQCVQNGTFGNNLYGNNINNNLAGVNGACGIGMIQTSVGCLPQSGCQVGCAYYAPANRCIVANTGFNNYYPNYNNYQNGPFYYNYGGYGGYNGYNPVNQGIGNIQFCY